MLRLPRAIEALRRRPDDRHIDPEAPLAPYAQNPPGQATGEGIQPAAWAGAVVFPLP